LRKAVKTCPGQENNRCKQDTSDAHYPLLLSKISIALMRRITYPTNHLL